MKRFRNSKDSRHTAIPSHNRFRIVALAAILAAAFASRGFAADDDSDLQWPSWRGPLSTGVAPHADPPTEWSESKNIRWKTPLPGTGHSTPIVWGDHIFVTTAERIGKALEPRFSGRPGAHDNLPVDHRHRFSVLAVNRKSGKILWQTKVRESLPHEGGHNTASLASNSPVTDGNHVFASFGSQGIYCLDFEGNVLWDVDPGDMHTKHGHGEGASPVVSGDTVFVNWDHEEKSFLLALDKRTGKQRWKVDRDEVTSWASPIVITLDGRRQLVVSGTGRIRGYDPESGDVIWECGGLSANVVASPVFGNGIVYAASSYDTRAMFAIRLASARGDVTGTDRILWSRRERTPYVPSPLLYGDFLYFLRHYQGILSRLHGPTGEERDGPYRLGSLRNIYASPVGAGGRVYITDLDGSTMVISHEDKPRLLSRNLLDEGFSASAAITGNSLFLRGSRHLYRISSE